MLVKGYKALWAVYISAAIATCVVSGPTSMAAVVFGFAAFGMIFLGMLIVMPFALLHENGDVDSAVATNNKSVRAKTKPDFDAKWLNGGVPAR